MSNFIDRLARGDREKAARVAAEKEEERRKQERQQAELSKAWNEYHTKLERIVENNRTGEILEEMNQKLLGGRAEIKKERTSFGIRQTLTWDEGGFDNWVTDCEYGNGITVEVGRIINPYTTKPKKAPILQDGIGIYGGEGSPLGKVQRHAKNIIKNGDFLSFNPTRQEIETAFKKAYENSFWKKEEPSRSVDSWGSYDMPK